jgi:hypothetical protein
VLAAAVGVEGQLRFAGLIGLEDAVRDDSRAVVKAINDAGVRVVMITGDNALTARAVAQQVGITPKVCPPEALHGDLSGDVLENNVFAGVFPEDKFKLVRGVQRQGAVVGMSGDGVNDAPALRQAEAGIAVANATDVAKAAAAIVLTKPGLSHVVPAIETSRRVFQRVLTYTLNMLSKKIELMLLLVAGFLLTSHKPLTPLLMVLIIFLNDFLTMALATDRMSISSKPNPWRTRPIVVAAVVIGLLRLVRRFCHRPLRAAVRHAASPIIDIRRHYLWLGGGRLSAARARALLGVSSQPRNGPEHVDGAECNRIHHAGGLPCSSHQSPVVWRRGRDRGDLFFRPGLAQSLAVRPLAGAVAGSLAREFDDAMSMIFWSSSTGRRAVGYFLPSIAL